MKKITQETIDEICRMYRNGISIGKISKNTTVSEKAIRRHLIDNGITITDPHAKSDGSKSYSDIIADLFPAKEGYHYIAVFKDDGTIFTDYLNRSGKLTRYIHDTLGVEIPSLFKRQKYFNTTGVQWHDQWFEYRLVPDEDKPLKKCPYCSWTTSDVTNKSGAFENHLKQYHGMDKFAYLKEFPEERSFFALVNPVLDVKMDNNKDNFVVCAICGEKMRKIGTSHLKSHGITKLQYMERYDSEVMCKTTYRKFRESAYKGNTSEKHKEHSNESVEQRSLREYLESMGAVIEVGNRTLLNGQECDMLLKDKHLAIEYDGHYFHAVDGRNQGKRDKNYHLDKTLSVNKRGYRLIHVFEDEYLNKPDIVKNKLCHIIGLKNRDVINIRSNKCYLKEITQPEADRFLDQYHIQGKCFSTSVRIGCFTKKDDVLISVMTFLRIDSDGHYWDLNRFATNPDYHCYGLGGKSFKYFIETYHPWHIKSFADLRWTIDRENNLYTKLGFHLDKVLKPDYSYCGTLLGRGIREHKASWRIPKMKKILMNGFKGKRFTEDELKGKTETEMAKMLGLKRIYNCGLLRYVWESNTNTSETEFTDEALNETLDQNGLFE